MNPVPGRHDGGPAAIVDREPGERASSQGADAIQPLDLKGAGDVFAGMVKEVDSTGQPVAEAAAPPATAPAAPASAPAPEPAPAQGVELYPENTPQGRLQRGYLTGTVPYSTSDVEACRPELTPEQYHDMHAAAVIADRQRATVTTYQTAQLARLHEQVPEARDPETKRQLVDELTAYAAQFDYTPEEILAVNDARAIELARDALKSRQKVRELERQLAAERAGAPMTDAAATARPAGNARQHARAEREARLQEAYERAAKTGRLRDAGDAFAALLFEKPE